MNNPYIHRTLEAIIPELNTQYPVVMVTGPRQVGKTSLLQYLSQENRRYVTLDDPNMAALAKEDPALLLERFPPPILIDEIQYAPSLFPHIKMIVDKLKKPGLFWLTGSQPFHLMKGVSESLAGRVALLNLLGLSQHEITKQANQVHPFIPTKEYLDTQKPVNKFTGLRTIYEKIWRGSFPKIATDLTMKPAIFYSSYIQTYLQRDIRDLARVGDETIFLRFLKVTAARSGQLLNITELAKDTDISPNTAKHWLSILETSGIIYFLQPYFNNITKRLVKAPKLYFLDTGLCAYLTNWLNPETLEAGATSGAILETYVVSEIIKSYWHSGLEAPIYYYRDKDQKEIDLIIDKDHVLYPVEIKKTASPNKDMIRHFNVLDKFETVGEGALICLKDSLLPLTDKNNAIPVNLI